MKMILVFFINLGLFTSCGILISNPRIAEVKSPKDFRIEGIPVRTPRVELLAKNSPSISDLVFSNGEIIGVGTDKQNRGEQLFVFHDESGVWETRPVIALNSPYFPINAIESEQEDLWIVGRDGFVLKKVNSQENWEKVTELPVAEANFLGFGNSTVAYIVCRAFNKNEAGLRIFKTVDMGVKWSKVYENLSAGNPFDLAVIDAKTVIVAMNDEYILRTDDGGVTWESKEIQPSGQKIDAKEWVKLNRTGAAALEVSSQNCWLVGESGSLFFSKDGGATWNRPIKFPDSVLKQSLNSISFSSHGTGVAVGDSGYIIFTTDFGNSWHEVSRDVIYETVVNRRVGDVKENLNRVKFFNDHAYIFGDDGVYRMDFEE